MGRLEAFAQKQCSGWGRVRLERQEARLWTKGQAWCCALDTGAGDASEGPGFYVIVADCLLLPSLPFSAMQGNLASGSYGNSGNCSACSRSFELSEQKTLFTVTVLTRVHYGQKIITFSKA